MFRTGAHEPVIPLSEVVGNAVNTVPEQTGETAAKVGMITASIVTVVVAVTPGQPPLPATV